MLTVQVQLIGTPSLHLEQRAPTRLERKDAAMLALLAIEGATPRARVAALLWPDVDDEHARNSLRQRLFRLHRGSAADVVLNGNVLQLAAHVAHDLAALPARLEADPNAAGGELLGNLDFADCAELADWVDLAREQWRATRRDALAEIAGRLEGERQIARGLLYAARLVADDPFQEHAHRRLMRLHYLRGDRSAALAAYEHARAVLKRELQVDPGRETEDLAQLIRGSGAPANGTLHPPPPRPRPPAIMRPPRLVGRESEWDQLRQAHAAQRVVLISGEPGIGKTRLISDFAASLEQTALFGARPGDARVPYALLARIVRGLAQQCGPPTEPWVRAELARIAPEFGTAAASKLEPLRLRQAVLEALAQWQRSGIELLALDDLHFADEATLELLPALTAAATLQPAMAASDASKQLQALAAESYPTRLTWLLGARSAELPPIVTQWLTAHHTEVAVPVELGPLSLAAIEDLLESLAIPDFDAGVWAAPLARHTGGNPMFILETLIALLAEASQPARFHPAKLPAPANVGRLIEGRLAQLSPQALKLARVAAIAGQDFSVELAGEVLGQHTLDITEAWRELESAHVIHGNAFAHDLIFEATQRSIPEAIARSLHRQVAVHLTAQTAPAIRLAAHWEMAGEWKEAGTSFDAAAAAAATASRRADEAELRERAATCHERAGLSDQAFASRLASVGAVLFAQSHERAEALTEQLLGQATSEAERLDALLARGNVLLTAVKAAEGRAVAEQARDLARTLGRTLHELDAACLLGQALAQQRHVPEAIQLMESFKPLMQSCGDPTRRLRYWTGLAYILQIANKRSLCAEALAESIALGNELGDLADVVVCTSNLSGINIYLGLPAIAYATAECAYRLCQRMDDTNSVSAGSIQIQMGVSSLMLGSYSRAIEHVSAALNKFMQGGGATWRAVAQTHLAVTYLHLGQAARARGGLTSVGSDALPGTHARRLVVQARIDRAMGKPGVPLLRDALALLGDAGEPLHTMLAELDMSREIDALPAAELCAKVRIRAERLEQFGVAIKARFFKADALLRAGQAEAAATEAREGLVALESRKPVDMYLPECWWIAFEALDTAGAEQEALACLRQAVDWIHQQALPNVPAEFRDGFLHRNPINRAVLTTAGRRLRD